MATQDIFNSVLGFYEAGVKSLTQEEIDAGTAVDTIFNNIIEMDGRGRADIASLDKR